MHLGGTYGTWKRREASLKACEFWDKVLPRCEFLKWFIQNKRLIVFSYQVNIQGKCMYLRKCSPEKGCWFPMKSSEPCHAACSALECHLILQICETEYKDMSCTFIKINHKFSSRWRRQGREINTKINTIYTGTRWTLMWAHFHGHLWCAFNPLLK